MAGEINAPIIRSVGLAVGPSCGSIGRTFWQGREAVA